MLSSAWTGPPLASPALTPTPLLWAGSKTNDPRDCLWGLVDPLASGTRPTATWPPELPRQPAVDLVDGSEELPADLLGRGGLGRPLHLLAVLVDPEQCGAGSGRLAPGGGIEAIEDESRLYKVSVPEDQLDELRKLLRKAANSFDQQVLYLSVRGFVEYLEPRPEDGFLE